MSSEACVYCALPSKITSALDPTLSTSQLVTIETFSPALCVSAHTNNYFYFYYDVSTLNFCINALHRLIVIGASCHPCLRINEDTIQYNTIPEELGSRPPDFEMGSRGISMNLSYSIMYHKSLDHLIEIMNSELIIIANWFCPVTLIISLKKYKTQISHIYCFLL